MTESSTEDKKAEVASTEASKEEKTVPVAAIGASRAKARAAQSEVERLQGELTKAQNGQVDAEALSQLVARMVVEERQKVEQEMRASFGAEVEKVKLAAKHGLSDEQVGKVTSQQQKHPSLSFEQALQLARAETPDVFGRTAPQPAWNRAVHGGLPVTGVEAPTKIDYRAKMREAEKNKDFEGMQHFAAKAFQEQLFNLFPHMRSRG